LLFRDFDSRPDDATVDRVFFPELVAEGHAARYVARRISALARRQKALETCARQAAERELVAAAREAGLLKRAGGGAVRVVEGLLRSLGYRAIESAFARPSTLAFAVTGSIHEREVPADSARALCPVARKVRHGRAHSIDRNAAPLPPLPSPPPPPESLTDRVSYSFEYGEAELEMHRDSLKRIMFGAPLLESMSMQQNNILERFSHRVMIWTGSTPAFIVALSVIAIWAVTGPLFHYSDTWQLIINTGTTVVTFLMVFLIQRGQNKDAKAVSLKLNEIVAALDGASNALIDVEDLSEKELDALHAHYQKLVHMSRREQRLTESHSVEEAEARHVTKQHATSRRRRIHASRRAQSDERSASKGRAARRESK
jgi:low affinity Fe/Cu permease